MQAQEAVPSQQASADSKQPPSDVVAVGMTADSLPALHAHAHGATPLCSDEPESSLPAGAAASEDVCAKHTACDCHLNACAAAPSGAAGYKCLWWSLPTVQGRGQLKPFHSSRNRQTQRVLKICLLVRLKLLGQDGTVLLSDSAPCESCVGACIAAMWPPDLQRQRTSFVTAPRLAQQL